MTREGMLNAAFDQVMSAPGMPNESDPDYERWLFDAFVAAIEAAGVRLVPVGEARAQLIDGDERTTVRIFTPYGG